MNSNFSEIKHQQQQKHITQIGDSILKELDSRLLHLEKVYVYILSDVKEFLNEIPIYEKQLDNSEYQLNHALDVINVYCQKLRKSIENETKDLISKINSTNVNEIQTMNASHKQLIEKVNKYEENLVGSFSQSEGKVNNLLKNIKRLQNNVDQFRQTWNDITKERTVELGRIKVSDLKQV